MSCQFSILTANYNRGKYIEDCIVSILNQTFKNFELIIIDDASTDNSVEIIEKYMDQDPRIKLIKHNINMGYSRALISGINSITSPYFGIVDSDDVITDDAIEIMYQCHVANPDCGLIYSQFLNCDDKMNKISIGYCKQIPKDKTNLNVDKVSHFKTFKKKYYDMTDGFHKKMKKAIDKDISYKMEEVSDLLFVDKVLYLYRIHEGGISQKSSAKLAQACKSVIMREAIKRRVNKVLSFVAKIDKCKSLKTKESMRMINLAKGVRLKH